MTRTPTSTHITIYAEKPSLVIGRGGHRIKKIIKAFEEDFGIENPQVDAQELEEPDLDAAAVAKNISGWLEKGGHPKRVGNTYARRVMESGAVGVQIEISGKLSGSRGRTEKFIEGYVKKCGNTAKEFVDYSYEKAVTKPGTLGVKVYIMKDMPHYMKRALQTEEKDVEQIKKELQEEESPQEGAESEDEAAVDEAAAEELTDEQEADDRDEEIEEELAEDVADDAELDDGNDEETEEPEADGAADTDAAVEYEAVVERTVDDVKTAVEEQDLDPAEVLDAEQANKDRVTLVEWLERRVE
jgi:small subunit ribosomal protein S3